MTFPEIYSCGVPTCQSLFKLISEDGLAINQRIYQLKIPDQANLGAFTQNTFVGLANHQPFGLSAGHATRGSCFLHRLTLGLRYNNLPSRCHVVYGSLAVSTCLNAVLNEFKNE